MLTFELTNGKQTILFEGTSHIGSREYYNGLRERIRDAKRHGFVYFYEKVKPGTPRDNEDLGKLLGYESMDVLKRLYAVLARLARGEVQLQEHFLGLGGEDVNADVGMGFLYQEMFRRGYRPKEKIIRGDSFAFLESLDANGLPGRFLGALVRTIVPMLGLKYRNLHKNEIPSIPKSPMGEIAAVRDDYLFNYVKNGPERIVITYGTAHIRGLFSRLKKDDPNWQITKMTRRSVF